MAGFQGAGSRRKFLTLLNTMEVHNENVHETQISHSDRRRETIIKIRLAAKQTWATPSWPPKSGNI
jgi:hypothetical protein